MYGPSSIYYIHTEIIGVLCHARFSFGSCVGVPAMISTHKIMHIISPGSNGDIAERQRQLLRSRSTFSKGGLFGTLNGTKLLFVGSMIICVLNSSAVTFLRKLTVADMRLREWPNTSSTLIFRNSPLRGHPTRC